MKIPFFRTRFVKVIEPNRFEFKPRYYDPVKDELEQRVAEIKRENGLDNSLSVEENRALQLRAKFQQKVDSSRSVHSSMSGSFRIVLILSLILLFSYLLFANLDRILAGLLR
jgi:hypothetical protein